jgi:hypothetical protein
MFQVCVKECPKTTNIFETELTASTFPSLKSSMVCTDEVNMDFLTYNQAVQYIKEEKCASYVLKSQPGEISRITLPRCLKMQLFV